MIQRSIDDLASDLDLRRREDEPRHVVLLGAGASVDAGIGAMPKLMRVFGATDFTTFAANVETFTQDERYRRLAGFLQSQEPAKPTAGYRALASLCAEQYFDVILTTNLDPLLDDALAAARLWRRDYLLLVNGIVRRDRLELLLRNRSPRVKVLKLHGDLFHRFMAWTPVEMDAFFDDVGPALKKALYGRDLLVIGHSLRDARIRDLVVDGAGVGGNLPGHACHLEALVLSDDVRQCFTIQTDVADDDDAHPVHSSGSATFVLHCYNSSRSEE